MVRDIAVCAIISLAVQGLWYSLELLIYGEIQPRAVDDIIGLLLVSSIFLNYKLLKYKER